MPTFPHRSEHLDPLDAADLNRFIDMANAATTAAATGGAQACRAIAIAIAEHYGRLDGRNRNGLELFMQLTSAYPGSAADLLSAD